MDVRYTIRFTGRVQGVGFRYTTANVASGYSISGWVRNEADGSVLCVVEGAQEELERFIAAVRQAMAENVQDVRIDRSQATGEFHHFRILH